MKVAPQAKAWGVALLEALCEKGLLEAWGLRLPKSSDTRFAWEPKGSTPQVFRYLPMPALRLLCKGKRGACYFPPMGLNFGFLLGMAGAFYLGATAFMFLPLFSALKREEELPEGVWVGWLFLGLVGGFFGVFLFLLVR